MDQGSAMPQTAVSPGPQGWSRVGQTATASPCPQAFLPSTYPASTLHPKPASQTFGVQCTHLVGDDHGHPELVGQPLQRPQEPASQAVGKQCQRRKAPAPAAPLGTCEPRQWASNWVQKRGGEGRWEGPWLWPILWSTHPYGPSPGQSHNTGCIYPLSKVVLPLRQHPSPAVLGSEERGGAVNDDQREARLTHHRGCRHEELLLLLGVVGPCIGHVVQHVARGHAIPERAR